MAAAYPTQARNAWLRCVVLFLMAVCVAFVEIACHSKTANSSASSAENSASNAALSSPAPAGSPLLTAAFGRRTGDLDVMIKRREIRALVVYSKSAFFYDQGHPKGTAFEALEEFQRILNRDLKTGNLPIIITFLPVGYDQLEEALLNGSGDLIAIPVAITPEREQKVAFSVPVAAHVKQIVVTGPTGRAVMNLDELSGKVVFVNPLSVYSQSLQNLNKVLESKGKKPVIIKSADQNLGDEDLLEMVNVGLIPAIVTTNFRAVFWAKVFDRLHLCSECVLSDEEQLAWAMRKDSPELKRAVDNFVVSNRIGTVFGNTIFRRYLQNTKWVKNATSDKDMEKFKAYVDFFKKYASQYDFDYLMLVALSYQESGLNQNRRSPVGAVGIMQVMPKYAAASPISISGVYAAEPNIHAGTKMLRMIEDTYFEDEKLDTLNKTLLTFASYNAGPARISALRKKTASQGLNPNIWFGNVEFVVAKEVGQETVRYVSNIYKYYVAYRLALEQLQERAQLRKNHELKKRPHEAQ